MTPLNSVLQSICIVRLSALGDVLMLVPLVRTLQQHFPTATITWVISKPAYDLVADLDGVEFILIDKPNSVQDYWRFYQCMRGRRFDVLLATQACLRANILYACIRAIRKIGYDKIRAKDLHPWFIHEMIQPGHDHTLDGFLKFASHLGITSHEVRWDLPIAEKDTAWALAHIPEGSGPLLLVNPAASKPERAWLPERYIEVILYAQKRWQARVVLTGGPGADDQRLGALISAAAPVVNLIGKSKPKQLLALIRAADVLLCPDTGPSHMGAAVGTPVLALHAVTSAAVSGPYPFRHLAVDYYPEAMVSVLGKTEATNVWGTHAHGAETMALIPTDIVKRRLDEILENGRACAHGFVVS